MQIKTTAAFVTTDGKQFFKEEEARQHERTEAFKRLYGEACFANPNFARLDMALLLLFVKSYGVAIGKIAGDPIPVKADPGESYSAALEDRLRPAMVSAVFDSCIDSGPKAACTRQPTPGVYRPTLEEQEARAREILNPVPRTLEEHETPLVRDDDRPGAGSIKIDMNRALEIEVAKQKERDAGLTQNLDLDAFDPDIDLDDFEREIEAAFGPDLKLLEGRN